MARSSSPAAGQDKFILRLPDGMRAELKELAAEHTRSLNAEIVARLSEFQSMDERLYATILENKTLTAEVNRLRKLKKAFDAIRFRFIDEDDRLKPIFTVPRELHDRIRQAAERNYRSIDAEATATLEEVYPPLRLSPFSDLELRILQWHSDEWHLVDMDAWQQFRAGELPTQITSKMGDRNNYFAVAVLDEAKTLCNVIPHNYMAKGGNYVSAAFELLTKEEIHEYNRLMTAASHTKADEARLRELRTKMEPAFDLPRSAIPKLVKVLEGISPTRVVRKVLRTRDIITR